MGLIIKSTPENKIKISGTDFELEQVYGRIAFAAKPNGREMEISTGIYANIQMYEEGKYLFTTIPTGNFNVTLPEGVSQSIESALQNARIGFIQLGYDCEIVSDEPIVDNQPTPNEDEGELLTENN